MTFKQKIDRRQAIALGAGLLTPLAAPRVAWGGKYNPELDYGDAAPAWKDLPGVDGKKHSLSDLAKKEVVVVVFTCNSCPYAVEYEDRILAFTKKFTGKDKPVALVAINVNRVPEDLLPKMKEKAEKRKFTFPYLYDETQEIAKKYGAIRTPEFFVLNQQRKVVYMGAMDDNTDPGKVKRNHVELAVKSTLANEKPEVVEEIAIGCAIRFERRRRRRSKGK